MFSAAGFESFLYMHCVYAETKAHKKKLCVRIRCSAGKKDIRASRTSRVWQDHALLIVEYVCILSIIYVTEFFNHV